MDTTPELQTTPATQTIKPEPIAPLWHTLLLVGFIVAFSAAGANSKHVVGQSHRELLYLTSMAVEWIMFGYAVWSIRRAKRTTVREVIGGKWNTPEDFLIDVVVAAVYWVIAFTVIVALGYLLQLSGPGKVEEAKKLLGFITPQTPLQAILFGGLCITAGFCEEFLFRGYIQRQFAGATRNIHAGIVISAVFFGLAHGYEGSKRMFIIFIFGMMFGYLAHLRKSLRPGMMAHTWHDVFQGIVLYVVSKMKLI